MTSGVTFSILSIVRCSYFGILFICFVALEYSALDLKILFFFLRRLWNVLAFWFPSHFLEEAMTLVQARDSGSQENTRFTARTANPVDIKLNAWQNAGVPLIVPPVHALFTEVGFAVARTPSP